MWLRYRSFLIRLTFLAHSNVTTVFLLFYGYNLLFQMCSPILWVACYSVCHFPRNSSAFCAIFSFTLFVHGIVFVRYQWLVSGVYQDAMNSVCVLSYLVGVCHNFHGFLIIWASDYISILSGLFLFRLKLSEKYMVHICIIWWHYFLSANFSSCFFLLLSP